MDRRVARTKKNIYLAFFTLLQKKAMADITVSELAREADVDRKTFYSHYQTVQDVFEEFKTGVSNSVLDVLAECQKRGAEHQRLLDEGQSLERAEDIAPFDFVYFYDSLHRIMVDNMAFFEKLSKDTGYMFLKNEFKNVLKQALLDFYEGTPHKEGTGSRYRDQLYAEFISAGAISMWTDWLHHKQVPMEEFRDTAIEVLREAWKMGTEE